MKSKQLYPKSVRPISTNSITNSTNKHRIRCSLCDTLLKASTSHRYLLLGKSIHDNLDNNITYEECCKQYLNGSYESDKLHMICPKCCQNLQQVHQLHKNADELTEKIRHTWHKTKRLNRTRHSRVICSRTNENISSSSSPLPIIVTDDNITINIKEELEIEQMPTIIPISIVKSPISISESVLANSPYDLSNNQRIPNNNINTLKVSHQPIDDNQMINDIPKPKQRITKQTRINSPTTKKSHSRESYPSFLPTQTSRSISTNEHEYYQGFVYNQTVKNQPTLPYAQLMIRSPSSSSSSSSHQQQQQQQQTEVQRSTSSNNEPLLSAVSYEPSIDGDRSLSPHMNDDETLSVKESKNTRLSRRQYDFLVKLPDQQSLNAFIETSSSESGSRWTWRRTSANSRGYKVYYVCNFSMRRHYHPCPAAMYALFHPEGSISIYSCGQHQHIPKDRLPVSITDATKDEIFKCLQAGMATTDIREHLLRHQLPFGDTRKLNNFIKYHKELLRFGTVTNVRIGGTAYRQPQCWAIRRQPQTSPTSPAAVTTTTDQ